MLFINYPAMKILLLSVFTLFLVEAQKPIHFISEAEGILMQLFQLEAVWSIAKLLNRTVEVAPFKTDHFVSLCDIFAVPTEIVCMTRNRTQEVLNAQNCILTTTKCCDVKGYILPNTARPVHHVDYATIDCIIGKVGGVSKVEFPKIEFIDKYTRLLPHIKAFMGLNGNYSNVHNYAVAHWRHSEIFRTRLNCKRKNTTSCAFGEYFAREITGLDKQYADIKNWVITTDDVEGENEVLRKDGYKFVSDHYPEISNLLYPKQGNYSMTVVDELVIDLMLM